MLSLLDEVLPLKSKTVSSKPAVPWHTHDIYLARAKRRKLEKKWRQTKLTVHLELYLEQCKTVKKLLQEAKTNYYQVTIDQCAGDQKKLFQVVNKLLQHKNITPLPSCSNFSVLAERFAEYFSSKIARIRASIPGGDSTCEATSLHVVPYQHELTELSLASDKEIETIVRSSPSKQCSLDVIPTWLLKDLSEVFVPFIRHSLAVSQNSPPYLLW